MQIGSTEVRQAERQVRDAIAAMPADGDMNDVLAALRAALRRLAVPFRHCGINLVADDSAGQDAGLSHLDRTGTWHTVAAPEARLVVRGFWSRGEPVYRRDLDCHDPFAERERMAAHYGHPVRSVVDVPFAGGTLAVNSEAANAFSDEHVAALVDLAAVLEEGFRRREDLLRLQQRNAELEAEIARRQAAEGALAVSAAVTRVRNQALQMEDRAGWQEVALCLGRELGAHIAFDTCCIHTLDPDGVTVSGVCIDATGSWHALDPRAVVPDLAAAMAAGLVVHAADSSAPGTFAVRGEPMPMVRPVPSGEPAASVRPERGTPAVPGRPAEPAPTALRGPATPGRPDAAAAGATSRHSATPALAVGFVGGTLAVYRDLAGTVSDQDAGVITAFATSAADAYRRLLEIVAKQRLQSEVEEQRLRALQIDRLQALGEMASGIAHELNQPLNGIRAFAEGALLAPRVGWTPSPGEIVQTFRDIIGQVDRMSAIVDHMRVFARGDSSLDAVGYDLNEPIAGALKLMGAQLRLHGITVDTDIAADLPRCSGWPNAIEQVILNLVSNARDALNQRAARRQAGDLGIGADWAPRLTIGARAGGDGVRLTVTDNGGGIPPAVEKRIFDPFFTTKAVGQGTGIGLAIVRSIVDRNRGTVQVDNLPGEGVTFVISLPLAGDED